MLKNDNVHDKIKGRIIFILLKQPLKNGLNKGLKDKW